VGLAMAVRDAQGNPAEAAPLLSTTFGRIEREARGGPGEFRAVLAVPERLSGQRQSELVAWVAGVSGRATVALAPGPVEEIRVEPPRRALEADGVSELFLPLAVVDRYGNPAEGVPEASAERGFAAAERDGVGWRVRYRPPRLDAGGEDRVHLHLGEAAGTTSFGLSRRTRPLDLALRLGLAVRAGNPAAPSLGLAAVAWPRILRGRLGLGLEASWSSLGRNDLVESAGSAVTLETRADFAALEAVMQARQTLGSRLVAWADLGGGATLALTRLSEPGLPAVGASRLVPCAHGALALGLRSGPFLEARAAFQGDARSAALQGAFTTFTVSMGWRLETL